METQHSTEGRKIQVIKKKEDIVKTRMDKQKDIHPRRNRNVQLEEIRLEHNIQASVPLHNLHQQLDPDEFRLSKSPENLSYRNSEFIARLKTSTEIQEDYDTNQIQPS